jgi:hypothetical protein
LPKAEQHAPEWQTPTELLILIAEHGGDPMMARCDDESAASREPHEAQQPRRKRAKAYQIVR